MVVKKVAATGMIIASLTVNNGSKPDK